MNQTKFLALCVVGFASLTLLGCIAVRKVRYDDAPRTSVQFDSAEASSTFYDAILARKFPSSGKGSRILVGQTLYSSETRPSANVLFNAAVTATDANRDGMISTAEAQAFGRSNSRF